MPETVEPAQNSQLPDKGNGSQEKAEESAPVPGPEVKSTVTESARTSALKARKRTKTGCLTCRKRRIKCGEERPTCKNCVKSKRDCEGYIPRVIFKDPLGAYRPGQQGIIPRNPQSLDHNGVAGMYESMPSASSDTPIAPRLPHYTGHPGFEQTPTASGPGAMGDMYATPYNYGSSPYSVSSGAPPQHYLAQAGIPQGGFQNVFHPESFPKAQTNLMSYPTYQRHTTRESDSRIDMSHPDVPNSWSHGSEPSTARSAEFPAAYAESPSLSRPRQHSHWSEAQADQLPARKPSVSLQTVESFSVVSEAAFRDVINHPVNSQNSYHGLPSQATPQTPQNPWAEEPEEEYFDVDSDDEDFDMTSQVGGTPSYNLGPLIAMSANHHDGGIRSMTNFLKEPNILATYHPSYAASPLMDSHTARVFCHFITATAPTLAVCERRPSNPTVIFSGVPVPKSQRALWSYTLPMLALTHQGLLHAMLALASLHIAKLQQSSPTPSLKHYHYALRRVAKALGNQKRRKDVATLAATLLLGFYEVTTAEHNKWNSHLSGARELVMDIDFAGMAKKIETHRCQQEEAEAKTRYQMHNGQNNTFHPAYARRASEDFPTKEERQLDENLISTIMGWKTKYNQHGQIIDDSDPTPSDGHLTSQDVENFEIQCDLFWWYAKQDMYQSIVSGNRLLLSYDRWGHCPPRAPVGRLDAVYGSLDHLLLLMGRMADFAGRDLPRKLRAQREAEKGSQSRSCSGRSQTTQPSPQQGSSTMPNGMQAPPMYGMMPDRGPVRLPRGFDQAQHDQIYTAPVSSEAKPLETATHEAEAEWASIAHAFDVYADSLGPAYAPLEPEHMTPMATPFGPALYFRSYSIACVLTMYYCGRIICMRVKPNMPPAAMAAVGVAAQSTAHYANTIGRICAGIQPIDSTVSINPHHGAALMDCCMSLFQAGVQYRDPGQRGWTITKLRDVARLTGWQTSALIASGCERAWMRAAEMGKGPPYTWTRNRTAKDDRVAGRGRDAKSLELPPKDNNDRRFITVNAGTRVYWALGILGVEEDMQGMKLD